MLAEQRWLLVDVCNAWAIVLHALLCLGALLDRALLQSVVFSECIWRPRTGVLFRWNYVLHSAFSSARDLLQFAAPLPGSFMNFELANWHLSEKGTGGKEITLWLKKISRRGENFLLWHIPGIYAGWGSTVHNSNTLIMESRFSEDPKDLGINNGGYQTLPTVITPHVMLVLFLREYY